jgi:hypothetical protein
MAAVPTAPEALNIQADSNYEIMLKRKVMTD